MSTEPIFVEGSVTPPTSIASGISIDKASSQTKGIARKKKIIPLRSEIWSHFTKIINNESARSLKYHIGSCKKNPSNIVDTRKRQLVFPSKGVKGGMVSFNLEI
ncbi:hypothetical protein Gotur_011849 [Gossypium turneri]